MAGMGGGAVGGLYCIIVINWIFRYIWIVSCWHCTFLSWNMKTGSSLTDTLGGELLATGWWGEPNVRLTSVSSWARSPRVCAIRVQKSSTSERALVLGRATAAAEPGGSRLIRPANESSSARTDVGCPLSCSTSTEPVSWRRIWSRIIEIRSKLRPVGTLSRSTASFNSRRVAFCCSAVGDPDKLATASQKQKVWITQEL